MSRRSGHSRYGIPLAAGGKKDRAIQLIRTPIVSCELHTICHFPEIIRQFLRKDLPRVRSPLLGVEPVEFVHDGNLVQESSPVESLVKGLDF